MCTVMCLIQILLKDLYGTKKVTCNMNDAPSLLTSFLSTKYENRHLNTLKLFQDKNETICTFTNANYVYYVLKKVRKKNKEKNLQSVSQELT